MSAQVQKSVFPESPITAPWDSPKLRPLLLQEQAGSESGPRSFTMGNEGKIMVAIIVLRTVFRGTCHIGSSTHLQESEASTLSASGCWALEAALILGFRGSGKRPG